MTPNCERCHDKDRKIAEMRGLLDARPVLNAQTRNRLKAISRRCEHLEKRIAFKEEAKDPTQHSERWELNSLRYAMDLLIAFGEVPEKQIRAAIVGQEAA